MWCLLVCGVAAAPAVGKGPAAGNTTFQQPDTPLPPLLQLGATGVDIAWHKPSGSAVPIESYDVLITVQRMRGAPPERIERSVGRETEYAFSPIPIGARSCFRVRAVSAGERPARSDYSGETCYSNCECEHLLPAAGKAPKHHAQGPDPADPMPAGGKPPAAAGGGEACASGGGDGSFSSFAFGVLTGIALAIGLALAGLRAKTFSLQVRCPRRAAPCARRPPRAPARIAPTARRLARRSARRRRPPRLPRLPPARALDASAQGEGGMTSPFQRKGARGADSADLDEYAHLTAPEQAGKDAVAPHPRDKEPAVYGGRRRGGGGVALAELEASSASAQQQQQQLARAGAAAGGGAARAAGARAPPPISLPTEQPPPQRAPTYSAARAPAGGLPALESAANVDPVAFESEWGQCAQVAQLNVGLAAQARRMPAHEAIELALAHAGMVCIAAGAVGEVHKAYFAAQLAPTPPGSLFMLELVIEPAGSSRAGGAGVTALAMFRCLSAQHLRPLALHFGALLSVVLDGEPFA